MLQSSISVALFVCVLFLFLFSGNFVSKKLMTNVLLWFCNLSKNNFWWSDPTWLEIDYIKTNKQMNKQTKNKTNKQTKNKTNKQKNKNKTPKQKQKNFSCVAKVWFVTDALFILWATCIYWMLCISKIEEQNVEYCVVFCCNRPATSNAGLKWYAPDLLNPTYISIKHNIKAIIKYLHSIIEFVAIE